MKSTKWMLACALGMLMVIGNFALVQGHGNGHGKGHGKHGDDDDQGEQFYKDHDREVMRGWYDDHQSNLPPGLAKRDRLPPGLEKQLARRGALPPGLQKRLQPCPEDLERRLPPGPPCCGEVRIGGQYCFVNRRNKLLVDIFHLESR